MDELKERCRACSQGCNYPSECSYFNKRPFRRMRQLLSEAADAIEELQKRVPKTPHGRLIDADALMHEFEKAQRTMEQHGQEYSCSFMSDSRELSTAWYCVEDMVENAPTILEAEGGECEKNCYYNTREVKTNADRIRAMTDEELAGFIANAVDCCNCSHPRNGCSENDETCAVCWLDWLKEEAIG